MRKIVSGLLVVGIDFRWREVALLAAALDPLAYLAATRERERDRLSYTHI